MNADGKVQRTDDSGRRAHMRATIAKLEPGRLLVIDGDIHGRLRWELTPDGDGTLLSFRSTVDLDPDYLTMVPTGWHFHLDALARHLEGGETDLVEIPTGTRSTPPTWPRHRTGPSLPLPDRELGLLS